MLISCIAHNSSEGNLIVGDDHTALIDCGMAFCAGRTIASVEKALGGRPLDYILLTHAHYDHVGALPYFRKRWPGLRLAASEAAAGIMRKDTPRRVIRELAATAGARFGEAYEDYDGDDAFFADIILNDGDLTDLGGLSVRALATPGHTRDSYCFFVPELELLLLNETPGVLTPDGGMYPCYLTSYNDAVASTEKCARIKYRHLSLPHRSVVDAGEVEGFFERALLTTKACYAFIRDMSDSGLGEDAMLDAFYDRYFSETLMMFQPREAFFMNARATIACTLREIAAGPGK